MDEADPAADAGVGAQALLGLAAGNTVRLPSLANLPVALSRHAATAQDTTSLLARAPSPPSRALNVFAHCASEAPLEPVQLVATSREHLHNEAQPQDAEQEVARSKAPIPRLPSLSASDVHNRKDSLRGAPSEAKPNASTHLPIPRLASISEWASPGTQSVHAPVTTLPRLQHSLRLHTIPPLPSLPPQPQPDCNQPQPWPTSSLHSLHAPFSTAPTHVTSEWPRPAPLVYTLPPHHSEVPSYYPYNGPAQYSHLAAALPQIRPHSTPLQLPQYVGARSSESPVMRSSSNLDQHSRQDMAVDTFAAQSMPHSSLLQMVNGVSKETSEEACGQRTSSDSLSTRAASNHAEKSSSPPQLPLYVASADEVHKNRSTRKTLFASSSSGRFVDLMNPTDTLATVASASDPLPVEDVLIESPGEVHKAPSAKMKMARQIFGSGSEVSRSREKNSVLRRKKILNRKEIVLTGKSSPTLGTPSGDHDTFLLKERANGRADQKIEFDGSSAIDSLKNGRKRASVEELRNERPNNAAKEVAKKLEKHRSQPAAKSVSKRQSELNDEAVESESDSGVSEDSLASEITRCPCGSKADSGTMIACDQCNTWQHRICMGFRRKSDVPHLYYCNICRPQDMKPNCVAHPKYKERQSAKDIDDQCEPILLSVKPLELRKRFSMDLRAKQNGTHLSLSEVFTRYANLYRTQFGKDRQSVIEGLVVLTEIRREDVVGRLENAIKRSKMSSSADNFEIPNGDRSERRKQSHGVPPPTSTLATHPNGVSNHSRQSQKRARSSSTLQENAVAHLESSKIDSGSISPEKELSSGERNRLSREERKVRQVMTLFARLEERDKKRPRLGEPTGSPRNSSVSSPRPLSGPISRGAYSPKSPTRNLRLSPLPDLAREHPPSPIPEKRKHVPSIPAVGEERSRAASLGVPVPKRERGSKDRKDGRRRENRDSRSNVLHSTGDSGRKHGIFTRRRERQVLASVGLRHRGIAKSEARMDQNEIDPHLLFRLKVPGPSVLGSKLVPRSRRSAADNEADDMERNASIANDLGDSKRLNKKKWLLSSVQVGANNSDYTTVTSRPVRKRARSYLYVDSTFANHQVQPNHQVISPRNKKEMPSVSMIVVSKREALPDGGKKLERSLVVEAMEDEATNSTIAFHGGSNNYRPVNFSYKKRIAMRLDSSGTVAKKPGSLLKPTGLCFKKRMLEKITSKSVTLATEAVSTAAVAPKPVYRKQVGDHSCVDSPKGSTLESVHGSGTKNPSTDLKCEFQVASGLRSPPPLLRSAVIRRDPNSRSKSLPNASDSDIVIHSSLPSPVLRSTRSPPSLRSAVITRDLNRRSVSVTNPKLEQPTPKSSASSPVLLHARSPPPLRSTKLPCLRSKPVASSSRALPSNDKQSGSLRQAGDGRNQTLALEIPVKEETTASDILQLRLKGFLSRSSDSKDVISPRGPTHGPYSHGRHAPMLPTPSASPRVPGVAPMAKYNGGNPWRHEGASIPKRLHAPNGPVSGSPPINARLGGKPKQDRGAMRNLGNKLPLANGKSPNSSTDTTPWGRYRQQNGWGGKPSNSSAKHTYSSVMPASNGHGSKSNGPRRKPFG